MKLQRFKAWLRLYFDAFEGACDSFGVERPYDWETLQRMYHYQCPSEMLVHFMIITAYLEKIDDEKIRKPLLDRIVSSYEMVKQDLGW